MMALYRIKNLDKRFKLNKMFNHTVCIDLAESWAFHTWITKAERFLQDTLGDQAELSTKIYGKWTGEYTYFRNHNAGYRITLQDEKHLSLLFLSVGYPKVMAGWMTDNLEGF